MFSILASFGCTYNLSTQEASDIKGDLKQIENRVNPCQSEYCEPDCLDSALHQNLLQYKIWMPAQNDDSPDKFGETTKLTNWLGKHIVAEKRYEENNTNNRGVAKFYLLRWKIGGLILHVDPINGKIYHESKF